MTTTFPTDHLSPSHLWLWRTCVRAAFYVYVKKLRRVPGADAARGTAIHHSAEQNYRSFIEKRQYLPEDAVKDLAASKFDTEAFSIDWSQEDEKPGFFKDTAIAMAAEVRNEIAPHVVPVAVETEMSANLSGVPLKLVGRSDVISETRMGIRLVRGGESKMLIQPGRHIRDLKSRDKAPYGYRDGKIIHGVHEVCQHATYRLIQQASGTPATESWVDYVWHTKKWGIQSVPSRVELGPEDVRLVLEDYLDVIRTYQSGLFPRTGRGGWFCAPNRCAGYALCILGKDRATDL